MIEQLLADLTASTDFGKIFLFGFLGGFALLVTATMVGKRNEFGDVVSGDYTGSIFALLGVVVLLTTAVFLVGQATSEADMKSEINTLHLENIMKLSCNEIRADLLLILQNKSIDTDKPIYDYIEENYEWEQDYYYTKCEIPLRDEILKLQDPAFTIPSEIINEVVIPMVENKTETWFKSDYSDYGKQYGNWTK